MGGIKYSVEQRVFMYDNYVKYSSWRKCCRKFRRKYPEVTVPCKSTIYKLVKKVHKTGSVLDKKKTRKRRILTEEMLDKIGARLEANPKVLLRHVALEFGVSRSTVCLAKRLLNQYSYGIKTTVPTDYRRSPRQCQIKGKARGT